MEPWAACRLLHKLYTPCQHRKNGNAILQINLHLRGDMYSIVESCEVLPRAQCCTDEAGEASTQYQTAFKMSCIQLGSM